MAEPARTTSPAARHGWMNHVPPWISNDPHYQELPAQVRHTLQTIVNRCDPPHTSVSDGRGDLLGAFGGAKLVKACGVNRCTFFRHVRRLIDLGYLLKMPGDGMANCYAVPGDRRAPLPVPAQEPPESDKPHNSHNSHNCAPQIEAPTRIKLRRNHHGYPPGTNPTGSGPSGFLRNKRGRITATQLADDATLFKLHAEYVARGLLHDTEGGEQYVFEAAENALRHGKTPGALFWTRILDYHQRKLPFAVSNEVADRARTRWKRAKYGVATRPLSVEEQMQRAEVHP